MSKKVRTHALKTSLVKIPAAQTYPIKYYSQGERHARYMRQQYGKTKKLRCPGCGVALVSDRACFSCLLENQHDSTRNCGLMTDDKDQDV